ncbi:MAG: hypothetical protein A3A58_00345 [Candidatus Blackburnbacteria bacterium RIFCSPLOWO2_01_FULL_41_27]|uniref:Uncharacterized protein n=2 Tax=Candidatus Blackburniibacteriota TaxID=1817898 RepID=A0A1G1VBF0_9BACT|nr:MAG: hypothetical protein A3F61_01570 [Candidatus Blackburnbacteria bacterium RIFCSPHIGHO2_12_FULL_41_13b]OGY13508.1 MAG: hypothetical protein A3A58_00345 [Candidatus Blackburnbacteria bacterium RIFCSPLOWO2_01_FULL_41_27]
MQVFPGVLKNTLAQGLSRLGTVLVSIFLTGVLYRLLKDDGFGAYSFISALVLLFAHISDWGTNIITVKQASQEKEKQPEIFGSLIIFRFVLAVVSFLLVNVVVRANPSWQSLIHPTTIASFVLLFLSFKTSAQMIFQTLFRLELSAVVDFLASLVFLLLVLLFVFLSPANLNFIMFAWVLATIVVGVIGMLLAGKVSRINWTLNWKIIKSVSSAAIPTGALLITFSLYNRIDIVILQYFQGNAEVAPYALAYKVYDNAVLGAAFLMNAIFPHLAREFAEKSKKVAVYYQKAFDLLFLFALAVFLLIFIFAPVIVGVLAGSANNPATGVLRILSVAAFIAYFNHLTGFSLIAAGRQKISLAIALTALSFNVLVNLMFVRQYSFTAAAYATVATEVLVLLISTLVIWKSIGVLPSVTSFPKTFLELVKRKI